MSHAIWEYKCTDKAATAKNGWTDVLATHLQEWNTQEEIETFINSQLDGGEWAYCNDEAVQMLEIATESGYLVRRLRYWLQSPIIIDMKQALYRPQTKFKHKIPYVEHLALLRESLPALLPVLTNIVRDYLVVIPRWTCDPNVPLSNELSTTTTPSDFMLEFLDLREGERIRVDVALKGQKPKPKLILNGFSIRIPKEPQVWIDIACMCITDGLIEIDVYAGVAGDPTAKFENNLRFPKDIGILLDCNDESETSLITSRVSDGYIHKFNKPVDARRSEGFLSKGFLEGYEKKKTRKRKSC